MKPTRRHASSGLTDNEWAGVGCALVCIYLLFLTAVVAIIAIAAKWVLS